MEGHFLKVSQDFLTHVIGRVNAPGLNSGNRVQIYPFSVKGQEIFVRKVEKGQVVGKFIAVNIMFLCLNEDQRQEIEKARELTTNSNHDLSLVRINGVRCSEVLLDCNQTQAGDKARLWFHTIEASVGVKTKKGRHSFFFYFPITVAVEKLDSLEVCVVSLNDLSLNSVQKSKIKDLLACAIINMAKHLQFTKKEIDLVRKKMDKLLETVFVSEEELLSSAEPFIVADEFELMECYVEDDLVECGR